MNDERDESVNRRVRSFVRRDSRLTKAQADALNTHLEDHRFVPTDDKFRHLCPLNLEIGAGDGSCTLALASQESAAGFVASEVYRVGLGRLLHAANARSLSNIRVLDDDIVDCLGDVPSDYFDRVMIFFPDPWPKKKHQKRRLVQQAFLASLARTVKKSGCLFIATDIEDYAEHIRQQINISEKWRNLAGDGRWAIRPIFRPQTKFELKGLRAGRQIFEIVAARHS